MSYILELGVHKSVTLTGIMNSPVCEESPKVLEQKIRPDAEIQLCLDVLRRLIFCTQTLYPAESTPRSVKLRA